MRSWRSFFGNHPDDSDCLFETAQYHCIKCEYEKAIDLYERAYAHSRQQPRFTDELRSIAYIYKIKGDYKKAAETCDRIIELLEKEWGMTEEVELQHVIEEKKRLMGKM